MRSLNHKVSKEDTTLKHVKYVYIEIFEMGLAILVLFVGFCCILFVRVRSFWLCATLMSQRDIASVDTMVFNRRIIFFHPSSSQT